LFRFIRCKTNDNLISTRSIPYPSLTAGAAELRRVQMALRDAQRAADDAARAADGERQRERARGAEEREALRAEQTADRQVGAITLQSLLSIITRP
jgi:hypothetical protein